jgi:molybdopterin-guanine dinucleotide biosynthesis protein A
LDIKELGPVWGVILAGGQARRLGGGDKGLRHLGGVPLMTHAIDRLRPQLAGLVLNANGDQARFAGFGLPVVADSVPGFPGPLAGLLAGLDWAAARNDAGDQEIAWVVSAPADCPFLPTDLVECLAAALSPGDRAAVAASQGRQHPVIGIWSVALRDDLRRAIIEDGLRRMGHWLERCSAKTAAFPDRTPDPFFNVNTPEDLAEATRLLAG